ncbi:MAG: glycogen/starch/alpha-glucan phosphorylase [Desulfobacterota bacterium]|nr:glycogen/starch/alpha-glucan phosphorylase [Thermodesulfobacteriota bacterium]
MPKRSFEWHIHHKVSDAASLKASILSNLEYRLAKDQYSATAYDRFLSTAYTVLERLVERWITTQQTYHKRNVKRVYYLSMEYLLGRSLENCLINLGIYDACVAALNELGMDLETIRNYEVDAGLGNGGLGRLAACFLDSLATLCIPAHGYGLRYEYGLFHQKIVNGRQVEVPDNWLARPNPWEIARPEYTFKVRFGGTVEHKLDVFGNPRTMWVGGDEVIAMAYDTPVPGYMVNTVNTLRLWSSRATEEFNLEDFNTGDYMAACQRKVMSENITKVLYPNDNFFEGKELRLRQEYFLVSASIQDILRRFKAENIDLGKLPDYVAIQLNDTHPALAIPELMRLLVDEEGMAWEQAWDITVKIFGYTNHTVLPEALEEWPVHLFERVLPRHLEIIYLINHNFLKEIAMRYPGDNDKLQRMSIIAETPEKRVRMAYLATIGSHSVNGVAELHSRLLRETILKDFYEIWPEKFNNKTNGVTPRRWMKVANPGLAALITEAIGDGWLGDLDRIRELERFADDGGFQNRWREVKLACKQRLAESVWNEEWIEIHPDSLIDVQVKRLHEYKRQLLFALFIIAKYLELKESPPSQKVPRTCIIGGKAAPGYWKAKLIIRFINNIANVVNNDPDVNNYLRVSFLPNYRVSLAERLIPAADLSEQISTAGKEASGTGNMKFALNGAITIGTLDGANIEIMEEVGRENIFIFGKTADEIMRLKQGGYNPRTFIERSVLLQRVLHLIESDFFCLGESGLFRPISDELMHRDEFCLMADFDSYIAAQQAAEKTYLDRKRWTKMSILNVARCSKFSSDRTIREYCRDIWNVQAISVPLVDHPE